MLLHHQTVTVAMLGRELDLDIGLVRDALDRIRPLWSLDSLADAGGEEIVDVDAITDSDLIAAWDDEFRFGFGGRDPMTLDGVGKSHGVTRERIR